MNTIIIKKKICFLTFVILIAASSNAFALCGDVSGDGSILSNDVLMVARASIGTLTLTDVQKSRADVVVSGTPDGMILSNDLLMIARASLGMITLICKSIDTGTISGRITAEAGAVLGRVAVVARTTAAAGTNARVYAFPASTNAKDLVPSTSVPNAQTDSDGNYTINDVPVGVAVLVVDYDSDGIADEREFNIKVNKDSATSVGTTEVAALNKDPKGSWCDIDLDKVNYDAGEVMIMSLTGFNYGSSDVKCGVKIVLQKGLETGQKWASDFASTETYLTIPANSADSGVVRKTIPFSWEATNTSGGSDYKAYTIREDGTIWGKFKDNFNIKKSGFVPLETGNIWVYDESLSTGSYTYSGTLTRNVTGVQTINGVQTQIIQGIRTPGLGCVTNDYVAWDNDVLYEYGYDNASCLNGLMRITNDHGESMPRSAQSLVQLTPIPLLKRPPDNPNDWLNTSWNYTFGGKFTVSYQGIGIEQITLPIGSYNAFKLRQTVSDGVSDLLTAYYWYSSLGPVKAEYTTTYSGYNAQNIPVGMGTIAQSLLLKQATVSGTQYNTASRMASLQIPHSAQQETTSQTMSRPRYANQPATITPLQLDNLHTYPNPWRAADGSIKFAADTAAGDGAISVDISIYGIGGVMVGEIQNIVPKAGGVYPIDPTATGNPVVLATWDATNPAGCSLASGVYLYYLDATDLTNGTKVTTTGKIVIIASTP